MITWILVANSSEAKFLTSENLRNEELKLLRKLSHPDSRKKITELVSDKPGHYKTDTGIHGTYNKNNPKDIEAEHFALQLAHELKTGFGHNQYKQLIIVTPPHFYGLIEKHIDKHITNIKHISKDYTKYTLKELATSLKAHLFV